MPSPSSRHTLVALFALLGLVSLFQAGALLKNSPEGISASGTLTKSMLARLNGLSEGIQSYLKNHDLVSLDRIKSEGQETSRLLVELKEEAAQGGNPTAYSQIEKAHELVREATLSILSADHALVDQRQSLSETRQVIITFLTERVEPSIRSNQLYSVGRLKAIHAAIEEMRNFSVNPRPEDDMGAGRGRFRRAIAAYEELSRTRLAHQWADKTNGLFDRCVSQAHDVQDSAKKIQAASENYTQRRNALARILQETHNDATFGFRVRSMKQLFTSGLAHVIFFWVLLAGGAFLIFRVQGRTETRLARPLEDILQCVEAAAAGDVSRLPESGTQDEVGRLGQAVGRLITVLGRSENLVYHLAALVESSGEAIISHSLEGTILSWNKGAQRIYGYSAEEMKGRSIAMLSPRDEESELMRCLRLLRSGERVQPFETTHVARSGRRVRALVRVSAILDSRRKVIGASFCAQDLTDADLLQPKSIEGRQVA